MTDRTRKSLITVALLIAGVFFTTMALTIVGVIGRANAAQTAASAVSPDDPTGLFVQMYQFIKDGSHLPAVGAGLMIFVWALRWAHAKLPAPVGPFFETKLGGYVLGFGTALNVYLGTALIAGKSWTVGLLFQAIGTGFAASGSWEGLMDVLKSRKSVVKNTTVTMLLMVALLSPLVTGCRPVKNVVANVGSTTLDCTVNELDDLQGLVPMILPQLGEQPDWQMVEAQLESAGGRVGLCVLASLIDRYTTSFKSATIDGANRANEAIGQMKAKFGIASVKTSVGVR